MVGPEGSDGMEAPGSGALRDSQTTHPSSAPADASRGAGDADNPQLPQKELEKSGDGSIRADWREPGTSDLNPLPTSTTNDPGVPNDPTIPNVPDVPDVPRTEAISAISVADNPQSCIPVLTHRNFLKAEAPARVLCESSQKDTASRHSAEGSPKTQGQQSTKTQSPKSYPSEQGCHRRLYFSEDELSGLIDFLSRRIPREQAIPLDQIPRSLERIAQSVAEHGKSIGKALKAKLDDCLQLLYSPPRMDWRPAKKSQAEQNIVVLIDVLVDLIGFVSATSGIWNLQTDEMACLLGQADQILLQTSETQRRILAAEKVTKAKSQTTTGDSTSGVPTGGVPIGPASPAGGRIEGSEAASRLASLLVSLMHRSSQTPHSLLMMSQPIDPIIEVLASTPLGHPPSVPSLTGLSQKAAASLDVSVEDVGPFIRTVDLLEKTEISRWLFLSDEMLVVLSAMKTIQSALKELSVQRSSEWKSYLQQRSLPRYSTDVPGEILGKVFGKSISHAIDDGTYQNGDGVGRKTEGVNRKLFQGCSSGTRGIQTLIQRKLEELAGGVRCLYRSAGSVLDGLIYEEAAVIAELTDATVVGVYVSSVAFLFYNDFLCLIRWLSPRLIEIRRKIKKQTAPVNSSNSSITADNSKTQIDGPSTSSNSPKTNQSSSSIPSATTTTQSKPDGPAEAKGKAAPFSALLQQLESICLTRPAEFTALVHLFLPFTKKSATGETTTIAPADKINRILIFLAWEGGLMSVYQQLHPASVTGTPEGGKTSSPSTPPSLPNPSLLVPSVNAAAKQTTPTLRDAELKSSRSSPVAEPVTASTEQIEDAVVVCIVEGCRIFKEKLGHALDLFHESEVTSNRGEQILDICQRILEALSLRFFGEMNTRPGRELPQSGPKANPTAPRWKSCLLSNLARLTMPNRVTKIVEPLPKLFGEFLHQSVFYSPPFGVDVLSADTASVATSVAAVARLSGVAADLDSKLTSVFTIAESSLVNTHANYGAIRELDSRLSELSSRCQSQTEGVIDRHTNQLKIQADLLEAHKKELGSINCLLHSHQARIGSSEAAMKKLAEETERKGEALECSVSAIERQCGEAKENFAKDSLDLSEGISFLRSSLDERRKETSQLEESVAFLSKELAGLAASTGSRLQQVESRTAEKTGEVENRLGQLEDKLGQLGDPLSQVDVLLLKQQKIEEEANSLKLSVAALNETLKGLPRTLIELMVNRTRQELSAYLTETLSQTVSNHVAYFMDKAKQDQQQSGSHSRIRRWRNGLGHQATPTPRRATSPPTVYSKESGCSTHRMSAGCHLKLPSTPGAAAALIHSTRRPFQGISADSLSSLADSSSILEENSNLDIHGSASLFTEIALLDLPDPRAAASFVSDGRGGFQDGFLHQPAPANAESNGVDAVEAANLAGPLPCQEPAGNYGFLQPPKSTESRSAPTGAMEEFPSPGVAGCASLRCSLNGGTASRQSKLP